MRGVAQEWEKCVEANRAGEDFVESCYEHTAKLKECMEAHADYYWPLLEDQKEAEAAAEEEAKSKVAAVGGDGAKPAA